MSVYWRVVLQVLVGRRSTTDAHPQERLVASRRPATKKSVTSWRFNRVVELTVGETVLVDDVLLRVDGGLYAVRALLSPPQTAHVLILRVVVSSS